MQSEDYKEQRRLLEEHILKQHERDINNRYKIDNERNLMLGALYGLILGVFGNLIISIIYNEFISPLDMNSKIGILLITIVIVIAILKRFYKEFKFLDEYEKGIEYEEEYIKNHILPKQKK